MARKPKTHPSPDDAATAPVPEPTAPDEAAVPARRGRKPKTAALLSGSPSAAGVASPATDDAGAKAPKADPIKTPGRRGPGRKPKQATGAKATPVIQDDTAEPRGQAPHEPEAEVGSSLTEDDALAAAAVPQAETAADSDPVQLDLDPGPSGYEAAQSSPGASTPASAKPAAHWDRATGRVQFHWSAIERTAAQEGPHQGMAKLLIAARAEGAQSRWPF